MSDVICWKCEHAFDPRQKKLPTLPDYIKEHGWPDWAKYAVVDGSGGMDGRPVFSDSQLSLIENEKFEYKGWRHTSDNTESYDNVFLDTTNWQNSLVEKCDLCSGTGLIGQGQPFGTVGVVKSICPTCNGTKIKPKQEPNHTELPNLKGLQCSNCNTKFPVRYKYCQNCGIKLSEEPKLKSLADEPWPDPNEGCSSRKVEDGNLKYFNQFLQEWHLVGTGYQDASQEKNPRYDDILWLRKWKGKKVLLPSMKVHCIPGKLSDDYGKFITEMGSEYDIKRDCSEVKEPTYNCPPVRECPTHGRHMSHDVGCPKCNQDLLNTPLATDTIWHPLGMSGDFYECLKHGRYMPNDGGCPKCNQESDRIVIRNDATDSKPKKRVPLEAKDFQNIRAIRRTSWLEDLERRFSEITKEGIIISGIVMSFDYLSRSQQDGAWEGITFDNKIVPLYKEE